eukprot:3935093-Rhodomonas_salina.1
MWGKVPGCTIRGNDDGQYSSGALIQATFAPVLVDYNLEDIDHTVSLLDEGFMHGLEEHMTGFWIALQQTENIKTWVTLESGRIWPDDTAVSMNQVLPTLYSLQKRRVQKLERHYKVQYDRDKITLWMQGDAKSSLQEVCRIGKRPPPLFNDTFELLYRFRNTAENRTLVKEQWKKLGEWLLNCEKQEATKGFAEFLYSEINSNVGTT